MRSEHIVKTGGYNLWVGGRVRLAQLYEDGAVADGDLRWRWQLEQIAEQHL